MFRNSTTRNMGFLKVSLTSILFGGFILLQPLLAKDELDPEWYSSYRGKQIAYFAGLFEGTKYDYANSDPLRGFDCSGYVSFVYGYFDIKVPRVSAQFDHAGKTIPLSQIRSGDILLFKGSNVNSTQTGHLGIVTEIKDGKIYFLHSATSNKRGIMTSNLDESYFKQRFIKAIRVL